MNVRTIAACTLLVLLFVALPARADVPLLVNYQGFLADDSGLPVTGSHDFTFRIYPDSTVAATPLWEETQAGIPVDGGVFTVMLGSLVAMPEDLFAGQERWLGLTLNTETEMIPRIRIVSAPYSLQAANADSAASVDWNNIANMPGGFADGVDDGGGAGDGFSLDASDGSPEDAVYVDDLGAVGVGTTSPTDLFDVRVPAGSSQGLSISHATSYNGCPTLSFNVAGQRVAKLLSHQVGQHLLIETEPGKGYIQLYPEGTFMMMVTPNGVGVNNSEPSEMLDVTGTVKATAFVGDGSGLTGLPSLTETDPTVPASIKDGIDWTELTGVPADFADGVDDVGSADGYSLDAADGGPVDVVYVDNLGAVGVGTTSPTDLFDVRVPAGSSQGLSISHATSYNGYPTLSFNVAGQRVAKLLSHQVGQHLLIETEPGKGYIQLYPEGTFMMMVTPNGVGVNNSEPSEMLDVTGTVKATAFVGDGSGLTGLPSLTETDPTVPASIKDGIDWTELTGVPADFADGVDDIGSADGYSLDAADGGPVDVVYVDNAGAVGVGTTSPTDILDVRVPAGSSDGLSISHATSYNGYPTLSFNVAGQRVAKLFSHQVGQHLLIETEPGKGYIQLYPEGTFMMMVTPDGVGINNSEPSEMLDVDGAVKATTVKVGDLVKLAPQSSAPASPEEGDLYMDGTTHKLMCYDGTTWQACF